MMNIDPVHLAFRSTVEGNQKILNELEAELAEVTARRGKILADIKKANEAAFAGDKRQLFVLARKGGLNEQEQNVGRFILSISTQIAEAKKRVAMAANHAAGAAAAAKANGGAVSSDRLFLVKTPNGGQIRHRAASIEALRSKLIPGYAVHGEIFGANDAGAGGVVAAIEPTGPSIMAGLLQAHGDELIGFLVAHGNDLLKWLAEHGIIGSDKTVVILPENGRELQ
jgi:hypothetical protein